MRIEWRQLGRGLVVLALLAIVCGAQTATSLDLRVQGRSRLDARAMAAGTHLLVRGELRDDLNKPLPQRNVGIAVYVAGNDRKIATRKVRTDDRGAFATRFDVAPGRYRVTIRFEATTHVTGTVFDETVEIRRQPVKLEVTGPSLVHGSGSPVHLSASATVGGIGVSLPLEIRNADGRSIERELDTSGRLRADIAELLSTGNNRIEVTIPGAEHRSETTQSIEIRKVERFDLEASVEPVFERLQRGAAVDGSVRAQGDPVGDVRVEATLRPVGGPAADETGDSDSDGDPGKGGKRSDDRRFDESGKTDASGQFHLFFGRDRLSDGEWRASIRLVPEVGDAVERQVGTFEIDRSFSRMIINGAAGLAVLALLLVVGREAWDAIQAKLEAWEQQRAETERRRRAFEEEETLEAIPVAPDEAGQADDSGRHGLRGQVWDDWSESPVEGATLRLHPAGEPDQIREATTDGDGRFAFGELDRGSWELIMSSRYYVRGRFSFEIPHDGSLANCRFELVPVPLKIRRLYQSLIELARGEDLWGRLSPREIRSAVAGVLEEHPPPPEASSETSRAFVRRIRDLLEPGGDETLEAPVEYLEALTDIVQETYFGPRRYDEATWELAREIALRLREELEADDGA